MCLCTMLLLAHHSANTTSAMPCSLTAAVRADTSSLQQHKHTAQPAASTAQQRNCQLSVVNCQLLNLAEIYALDTLPHENAWPAPMSTASSGSRQTHLSSSTPCKRAAYNLHAIHKVEMLTMPVRVPGGCKMTLPHTPPSQIHTDQATCGGAVVAHLCCTA